MAETRKTRKPTKRNHRSHSHPQKKPEKAPSWEALRLMFSCKDQRFEEDKRKKCVRSGCSVSLCSIKESSKILVKPRTPPPSTRKSVAMGGCRSAKLPLSEINRPLSSSSFSSTHSYHSPSFATTTTTTTPANSFRGLHLRRFAGCYECHTVMNPINGGPRNPSLRSIICSCPECGEMFLKSEILELHRAVKHAVSELGPEDSSRNIVEIIFQSSWLKKRAPPCRIDRILKVNNTRKTIERFEDCRDAIRSKATKLSRKYPRCIADGNELLRFHCTSFTCSLGTNACTALCHSTTSHCKLCSILRDGFKADASGRIQTMGTSGRAHDVADVSPEGGKRAMLVCRVIAGRVKNTLDATEEYDSVCSPIGLYSNPDKLFVFNPTAILPCFLVIYRTSH